MSEPPSLSIVVCTLDRPQELERCVGSVLQADCSGWSSAVEMVLVDDGNLETALVAALHDRVTARGLRFAYVKRPKPDGLFPSRVAGIRAAAGEIVLFLDDDVTIAPDYLARLAALYERPGHIAGIGGVDQLDTPRAPLLRLLHRLFLFDSGSPGKVSLSGFAGSLRRWRGEVRDFTSEFLHGCNMSFRRSAIVAIPDVPWLHGQSQGDDLYISLVAGQYGELLVSPALRAWHARPSGPSESRPARPDVIRAGVVSWYELLRLRHTSALRTVAFFWTITCFVLKDATRPRRAHLVPGYIQGTMDVIGARLRTTVAARSP